MAVPGQAPASSPPRGCPGCGGSGFRIEREAGVDYARPCDCRTGRRAAILSKAAQIPRRYEHCTFEKFRSGQRPALLAALELAQRVVEEYPLGDYGLLLAGPCGVGKTHLAVAILQELVGRRSAAGLFAEFTYLMRRIQDTYDRRAETPSYAVLNPALQADVLVLDDLGATRTTPWVLETLGLIINERYNQQRLTIITTNRPLKTTKDEESLTDRIGARLASRLAEMCWTVEIDSEDFRQGIMAANHRA